jgi:hypothetical protein
MPGRQPPGGEPPEFANPFDPGFARYGRKKPSEGNPKKGKRGTHGKTTHGAFNRSSFLRRIIPLVECDRAVVNSHSLEVMGNFRGLKKFLAEKKKQKRRFFLQKLLCPIFTGGLRGGFGKERNGCLAF